MTGLIVTLHVLVCLFLIAVILLQAGRGQGLSWGVFGGTPQSILGTKTASFLSRVTTGCAIVFLFTCILLNVIETRKSQSLLAPRKPISQVDLAKIKAALEEAEPAAKTESVPSAPAATPVPTPPLPESKASEPNSPKPQV